MYVVYYMCWVGEPASDIWADCYPMFGCYLPNESLWLVPEPMP